MVKDATLNPVPSGTFVDADNWEGLKQQGLIHCTNVLDYSAYGVNVEIASTRGLLEWEVGSENLFEGWVFIEGEPKAPEPPHEFWGPAEDVGFYVIPPDPDWTHPWSRMLDSSHPELVAAGLGHLLEVPSDEPIWAGEPRWEVWAAYGSDEKFRCRGPATQLEGTLAEVIDHMKTWEAEQGKQ